MIYGDVCSGISAPTMAWKDLGWKPAFFAEIDRAPCAVLKHHYPEVRNAGDFTAINEGDYEPIDVLVGGTPCQDFSVAGLRSGMDGQRGQLTIEFAHLAGRLRSRWLVWENVPGVLSIDGGRAFGTFIGILGQLGYGIAYRVLDAQYFGCACPRERVFVVGHLGDWRRSAAVLFERSCFERYSKASTETSPVFTATGGMAQDDRTPCILDKYGPRIATPIEWERALGFTDGYTAVPAPCTGKRELSVSGRGLPCSVRLMADGPRYKMLGNSMAVPVIRWIGQRIEAVEKTLTCVKNDAEAVTRGRNE